MRVIECDRSASKAEANHSARSVDTGQTAVQLTNVNAPGLKMQ